VKKLLIFTILTLAIGLACAFPGLNRNQPAATESAPLVTISSPVAGQKLEMGQAVDVLSTSVDAAGVVRTELLVDGQVVWVDANADPQPDTPFIVAQPWTPEVPGTYIIQVNAYNTDNSVGTSESLTIEVVAVSAATVGEASPTPGETDVPVILSTQATDFVPTPAETPTGTNSPPDTPTRPSVTPTDTPRSQAFASTGFEPEGRFNEIWLELGAGNSRLGYPIGPEIVDRNYARQHFENGLMFWWDNPEDPDDIWVMDSPTAAFAGGATSNRYADTWLGGDEYPCPESRNGGPVRGFGKLWCDRPELQRRLGHPSGPELGSGGRPPYAHVQFFQGGVMLYNPLDTEVYVLFVQGDWRRFDY